MNEQTTTIDCSHLVGEGQHPGKMQGHWVLARAGKRVLRPGGLKLTRRMLDALAITADDRVVEFAPGLGVTAEMVLRKRPARYWGVEREPAAAAHLRSRFADVAEIVQGSAEASGLPDACASVIYGEAMLSIQTAARKHSILAEAHRLLVPGGRYAIHELCLSPDDLPLPTRREIEAAMSREIHVGVQPLTHAEWTALLQQHGFRIQWSGGEPMHLLEPARLLSDEGVLGVLRIALNVATQPQLRKRVFAMRRLFREHGRSLRALSFVVTR